MAEPLPANVPAPDTAAALTPVLASVQEAIARMQLQPEATLAPMLTQFAEITRQVAVQPAWLENLARAMETMIRPFSAQLEAATQQWAHTALGPLVDALVQQSRIGVQLRVAGHLAGVDWEGLEADERDAALDVLDDAYEASTAVTNVPDDAVDDLEDTIRQFAASQQLVHLSPEMKRRVAQYFVAIILLSAMIQVALSSDVAETLMGKVLEYSPVVVIAMAATAKAWDRWGTNPPAGQDDDE